MNKPSSNIVEHAEHLVKLGYLTTKGANEALAEYGFELPVRYSPLVAEILDDYHDGNIPATND